MVRKARWAGALYGGREPGRVQRSPEVHRLFHRKVEEEKGREGDIRGGEDLGWGYAKGEPKRLEGPREKNGSDPI